MFHHSDITKWNDGRYWLHFTRNRILEIEWELFRRCSGALEITYHHHDTRFMFHAAIPGLFSLFVCWNDGDYYGEDRNIGVRFFDGGVWWSLWMPVSEFHSTDPAWRRGSFHPRKLRKQIFKSK